jgi:hypothetical protein
MNGLSLLALVCEKKMQLLKEQEEKYHSSDPNWSSPGRAASHATNFRPGTDSNTISRNPECKKKGNKKSSFKSKKASAKDNTYISDPLPHNWNEMLCTHFPRDDMFNTTGKMHREYIKKMKEHQSNLQHQKYFQDGLHIDVGNNTSFQKFHSYKNEPMGEQRANASSFQDPWTFRHNSHLGTAQHNQDFKPIYQSSTNWRDTVGQKFKINNNDNMHFGNTYQQTQNSFFPSQNISDIGNNEQIFGRDSGAHMGNHPHHNEGERGAYGKEAADVSKI